MKTTMNLAVIALLAGNVLGQVITGKDEGPYVCDIAYAFGNYADVIDLNNDLRDNGVCASAAHTCTRIACGNTSGVYLCNDNDYDIEVNCSVLADYADKVNADCTAEASGGPGLCENCTRGQLFDNRGFNVIVHGANCADPTTTPA